MKKEQRERLCKKFNIKDYSRGTYAEGLFDGLIIAEKYFKKEGLK